MMNNIIRYVSIAALIIVAIVVIARWRGCSDDNGGTIVTVPKDTAFAPIEQKHFQPSSLPFSSKKFPTKLPKGIAERDVERIITVELPADSGRPSSQIDIIETLDGQIFVAKDSTFKSITVTEIDRPLFSFPMRFGGGLTVSKRGDRPAVSVACTFAPMEWAGWLHAPIAVIDIDGIGIGLQAQVYHDIYAGMIVQPWKYEENQVTTIKATLAFMF